MNVDPDWRPITPDKVDEWLAVLEKGQAWRGFLRQFAASHRELFERAHGTEPDAQLKLFNTNGG